MKPQVKFGVLTGLILGVVLVISMMTAPSPSSVDMSNPWSSVSIGGGIFWWLLKTASVFGLFYLATKEVRDKELGGFLSFGKGFGTTYKTALVTLVVYALVSAVYFYIIDPDWYPISWDQMAEALEENAQGNADAVLSWMEVVFENISAITIVSSLITNAIAFAIVSLVVGGLLQKDNPDDIRL